MRRLFFPFVAAFALGFGVACQVYDFEPVTPLTLAQTTQRTILTARPLLPNLVILVDRSGSMNLPVRPGRTRIEELRAAMLGADGGEVTDAGFLVSAAPLARMGLAFFPGDAGFFGGLPRAATCESTTEVSVPLPPPTAAGTADTDVATLVSTATAIGLQLRDVVPSGGTPTGDSLRTVGALPQLRDLDDNREDFILLLTDGLPNCNAGNPNNVCQCSPGLCGSCDNDAGVCPAQTTACRCTLTGGSNPCASDFCAAGCLDQQGAVEAIRALRLAEIRTIVVGFGAETGSGDGPVVLNAMAEAGGFNRTCPDGGDGACGDGNTCNRTTGLCQTQYYQAANAAELSRALKSITDALIQGNPCEVRLDENPSAPELLGVYVDDVRIPAAPDTWSYTGGVVTFAEGGAICERIKVSTPQNPVPLQFRIVEAL